ncbi:MAG: 4Fe-4S ferredoxin, partial [Alistipes sp.]
RCCACVKGCPSQARVFETPFATLLARNFKRQKQPQTLI